MNEILAIAIILLLLLGPIVFKPAEHHIELFFLIIGAAAVTLAGLWSGHLVVEALTEPIMITVAVITAGLIFQFATARLDQAFARMRSAARRAIATALAVLILALASSLITAIVAALVLVEAIELLHLGNARIKVAIAGCFAIGMGSALTPLGEPLSALAAGALKLSFAGLFELLAPAVVPGVVAMALLAGFFARGAYEQGVAARDRAAHSMGDTFIRGLKVYGFIAGLVLIGSAFAPLAARYLDRLGDDLIFWGNMVSAALDNATLVAIEVHKMEPARARDIIVSLLVAGGMLIPGNVPNIIAAAGLQIESPTWARIGVPVGLAMMGIYFAVFEALG